LDELYSINNYVEGSVLLSEKTYLELQLFTYKIRATVYKELISIKERNSIQRLSFDIYKNVYFVNEFIYVVTKDEPGFSSHTLEKKCGEIINEFNVKYFGDLPYDLKISLIYNLKAPYSNIEYWQIFAKYKVLEEEYAKRYTGRNR